VFCLRDLVTIGRMADDRDDDDAPDYRGLDGAGLSLDTVNDVFDDGRTLGSETSVDDGRPKTLMELQSGINGATAMQMIDDEVFQLAVLANFVAVLLHATDGARHPRSFAEETRRYIEDKPVFQVRINGNPPPYVYVESKEAVDVDDDMRIAQ
jgi:hypothetical protein